MTMKWMSAWLLALCLPLAAAASADEGAGKQLVTMRLAGTLTVDTDGRVDDYQIRTKMPAPVKELLDKVIPAWRFEPVLVDGKVVRAQAPMRIVVAATEEGKGYRLRVDNVLFRANTREEYAAEAQAQAKQGIRISGKRMAPPRYPETLMMAGIEGIVLLAVRVAPDGQVADAIVTQSSLLNAAGLRTSDLDRLRGVMERSALAAARAWRFSIDLQPDTQMFEGKTVRVPVHYMLNNNKQKQEDFTGSWRREYRSPLRTAPWLAKETGEEVVGVSDLLNGEMLSGNPTLRLLNREQTLGAP